MNRTNVSGKLCAAWLVKTRRVALAQKRGKTVRQERHLVSGMGQSGQQRTQSGHDAPSATQHSQR